MSRHGLALRQAQRALAPDLSPGALLPVKLIASCTSSFGSTMKVTFFSSLTRDGKADGGDVFILGLDRAGEATLQLIGLVDDDLRILAIAVLVRRSRRSSASYGFLVLFSMRTDAITISPFVASAPRSVLLALSATVPAISINRPSSNSAPSSSLNCCAFGTSAGVALVALGLGLSVDSTGGGLRRAGCGWRWAAVGWLAVHHMRPEQAVQPANAPGSRLIDRHRTRAQLSSAQVRPAYELIAKVDRVKWKVVLAVGAVAGGAFWFVRRKSRRAAADAEFWAEATDPIARFGDA